MPIEPGHPSRKPEQEAVMKFYFAILLIMALVLAPTPAKADLKVATALSDLASVASAVGGEHVKAQSLCKGYEDPHFVPAKPSLMRAIRNADVFISTGLELDGGWLPLVLPGSRNPKIQPGAAGFVDASEGVTVLEKPKGTINRAEGDIHPLGNPHYYLDPKALEVLADHLAEVFSNLDASNAKDYAANAKAFDEKMEAALVKWQDQLKPFAGASVVTYHENFTYFSMRFGLKIFGTVEDKPGIPPSPRHIAELSENMKKAGIKVVIYQPYQDAGAAKGLAEKSGGTALEAAFEVGGSDEARDVFSKFDVLVSSLAKMLTH
jgi:ABC-type Zn uptake system ZnuABC Zn-binding protein ZnuA